ncbi:MAG: nucleotidyl transferase AbiEii/AbiGii toxin family protein [Verrucomicrobiota bacterium]
MKKKPIKNLSASVRQRLLNKAHETGRSFSELLQYYAMERFLYRLSQSSYANKFILKGALMFSVWSPELFRPTMDIDLLGKTSNELLSIEKIFKKIISQAVESDGIVFDADSVKVSPIAEDADYSGMRVQFLARLGTARINMQIDIGFGDIVTPSAQNIEYPSLLDETTLHIRGYPRESVVAEKFEVMIKLGELNSRMKDFFDIWFLSRQFDFEGEILSKAIMKTFVNRKTELPSNPVAFTENFARGKMNLWKSFIRRSKLSRVPKDFNEIISELERFLMPLIESLIARRSFKAHWNASGAWK